MKAIIAEPIPSLNKGEAAILRGLQEALAVAGITGVSLYSPPEWHEDDCERYRDIHVVSGFDFWDSANNFLEKPVPRGRLHFARSIAKLLVFACAARLLPARTAELYKDPFLRSLTHADLIVAGHDGMLGYNHFWIVLAARVMDKPIVLYGGGNDFGGRSRKWRVRMFLNFMADHSLLFTVRDTNTRDYFVKNGVHDSKIHVFPDPAVLLKPCEEKRVVVLLKREGIPVHPKKPLYGLIPVRGGIVADKSFSGESRPEKKHELRVELWRQILLHLMAATEAHFVFIPHCVGPTPGYDDRRMINDLARALSNRSDRFTVIRGEYSEGEYKGLLKRCEFILGERTHALIGAVSVATPCMALTVEEDLRMHNIIRDMFKRPAYNLNAPDLQALKAILTREWNGRADTALAMRREADLIHEQALQSAHMLKDRIRQYCSRNSAAALRVSCE